MGLKDLIKKAADTTTAIVQSEIAKKKEIQTRIEEQARMTRASFQISSGFNQVCATPQSTMFQRPDGTIYFNANYNDRYVLIEYNWSGPRFNIVSNSQSNTLGHETTNGKSGKMAFGAIVGTALMPGVGTAVGAAIGAGGKKKKVNKATTFTNITQKQIELITPATLKFKNVNTGQIASIVIGCNTVIDSQIKCFSMTQEKSVKEISSESTDVLNGIKALKELLDIGAITQEEYDERKNKLLDTMN